MFNFIQEHLSLVKSKMLRQRRQGGDQEEMGGSGYYIGEVNEVTLHFLDALASLKTMLDIK